MTKLDDETLEMLARQSKRERETANVGERLLAKGQSIVYKIPGMGYGEAILEHPDGSKFLIKTRNGIRISEEPYHE